MLGTGAETVAATLIDVKDSIPVKGGRNNIIIKHSSIITIANVGKFAGCGNFPTC
jgi:hypothetical protein